MSDKLIVNDERNINFYANSTILLCGLSLIIYFLKKNKKNIRDEESYDWTKYNISSEQKNTKFKVETKEKVKTRVKEFSKGTGFIKEEHKFQVSHAEELKPKTEFNFLNMEETENLQDMINYAASVSQTEKAQNIFPIESLFLQVVNRQSAGNINYTNDKIDGLIADLLGSELDDHSKIKQILELYSCLLINKNKHLSESTYAGLVELFLKNGYLNHASYFLCQMDRLKIKIPISLLDLFVDYSISNKIFESKEEITFKNSNYVSDKQKNKNFVAYNESKFVNKYDEYDPKIDSDYLHYFSIRDNYRQIPNIHEVFSKLKLKTDAQPFYPKKIEEEHLAKIKIKLSEIDTSKVKEFVPKNYKIVNKQDQ